MIEVPAELLSRYLERRRRDLEICQDCLACKKYEDLLRVGHQLKGNAETFGFYELSEIGHQLEEAASVENVTELERVLKDFSSWIRTHFN